MLKNYFKVALRNIRKNKVFSFINIFGLAIGLCSFMFIAVFVYSELNYDTFPKESENIYRVQLNATGNGEVAVYPQVDVAVGIGMKDAFPEIKASTRLVPFTEYLKYEDKQFKEEHIAFADSNFLQLFSIKLLEGNQATALEQPNSIVISKDFQKKYFGNNISPYGKYLMVGTYGKLCKITGVYDKVPDNAHFHFDAFISMNGEPFANRKTWTNVGFYTYLLLNKNSDPKKLEAKFPQLVEKYVVPETQRDMGVSLTEARKSINDFVFTLEPLNRIHLYSHTKYELEANGDIQYVYIFSALALFILLLAGINFTNLSTVKAVKRSREVGIRKVLGSLKRQLVTQFLSESVIITIFALLCAFGFALLLLPSFNQVANKHFTYQNFINFPFIAAMLVLCFLTGILAGIYPAFFLSSFNTIKVLKGNSGQSAKKSFLRSGLVVFQFFISISLIIATVIVYQQLHFMQNKKLGFEQDQVVYLPDADLLGDNQDAFKQQISLDSRVVSSTISWGVPGNPQMNGTEIFPKNDSGNGKTIHTNIYNIDHDYLKTLGIQIASGRNFSKDFPTDSGGVLINEAMVRQLGWSGTNPIGKSIVRSGQKEYKIVGVVKDFNYASARQEIAPLMMMLGNNSGGIILKIKTNDVQDLLAELKKQWDAFHPAGPFNYSFLNDDFAKLYEGEQRTQSIFSAFALLAIIIASLGLFGLSAFIIEQRTKEIGIRKVLGASVESVLILVSKEFLRLVSIAFLVSIPFTYWAMHTWLQDFAYRINISLWVFIVAGFLSILIAVLTISFQTIKTALMNPVKSMRSE